MANRINSKRKGNKFELIVAKRLEDFTGIRFRRTPLSGGWGEEQTAGDIIPMKPEDDELISLYDDLNEYTFECKNSQAWSLEQYFEHPDTSTLTKYLEQAHNESKDSWQWMLFATSNNHDIYVFSPYENHIPEKYFGTLEREDNCFKFQFLGMGMTCIIIPKKKGKNNE